MDFDISGLEFGGSSLDNMLKDTVRFASVTEFSDFLKRHQFVRAKMAGDANVLVNKSTRDFWRVDADDAGGVTIVRLEDPSDSSVTF